MNMHATIVAVRGPTATQLWDDAMSGYHSARTDFEQFDQGVWQPLADELDRVSPRPDLWFEVVARNGQTARYQVPANDLHVWDDHVSAAFRTKAAEVRRAWLDHKAAQSQLGYEAASDEVERLCNAMADRERDLLLMPAPDRRALLWKLERLFGLEVRGEDEFCDSWCPEWINAVMHDAGRLLSDCEAARIPPARALAA
jgi:hypothetical protein